MRLSGAVREYELHQWANDWLSINPGVNPHEPTDDKGRIKDGIVSPTRVLLNAEEIERLREDRTRACEQMAEGQTPTSGLFWQTYGLRTVLTSAGKEWGFLVELGPNEAP